MVAIVSTRKRRPPLSRAEKRYHQPMKVLALCGMTFLAATTQAQTNQDIERFERHVEAHDLLPESGRCVVGLTLNGAGYIVAMDLSKCATKDQASALARLGAALPFPVSSTVSRVVSIRL
jgi:hypothetical protein